MQKKRELPQLQECYLGVGTFDGEKEVVGKLEYFGI